MNHPEVISPHLDDATLSCWHAVEQPDSGVVNVFSEIPEKNEHTIWDRLAGESNSIKMMTDRLEEDRGALALADVVPTNLPYLDRQYRHPERDVFEIAESILEVTDNESTLYVPAGIGKLLPSHPDHVTVREAGKELLKQGKKVLFYADLPYALNPNRSPDWPSFLDTTRIAERLDLPLRKRVVKLSPKSMETKQRAIRLYQTQFKVLNLSSLGLLAKPSTYRREVIFEPVE